MNNVENIKNDIEQFIKKEYTSEYLVSADDVVIEVRQDEKGLIFNISNIIDNCDCVGDDYDENEQYMTEDEYIEQEEANQEEMLDDLQVCIFNHLQNKGINVKDISINF